MTNTEKYATLLKALKTEKAILKGMLESPHTEHVMTYLQAQLKEVNFLLAMIKED